MHREASGAQILVHQPIDQRAEQVRSTALGTGKHIHVRCAVPLPTLERLGDISRDIHQAIDLAFPVIDTDGPGLEVNRLPGQGTRF